VTPEPVAVLRARVDAAVAARGRLCDRPRRDTVASLARAAARWRDEAELRTALPRAARLSPELVELAIAYAAEALDPRAMTALLEREFGADAVDRPVAAGQALVAHVLASNVPALALPAIALGCLAGAAVLVKSGRDDRLSGPAFQRALEAVDPALAATVVVTYWPGGDAVRENTILGRADVVVASGGDTAVRALADRVRGPLVAHGPRVSAAVIGRAATGEAAALALARDVALHDQRGCLSPHVVWVEGDAERFAEDLAAALDAVAAQLPLGPATVAERAAARLAAAEAEWAPAAQVRRGAGGTVILDPAPSFRVSPGRRTVRVHPLADVRALPELLPPGRIECLGLAGVEGAALAARLRARGVSRLCPVGRMQRPRLSWPRGQQAPLGVLLGRRGEPEIEIEP